MESDAPETGSETLWNNFDLLYHEGGGTDSTSNGNTGTGSGDVTIGGATGPLGKATDFDGANDYVKSDNLLGVTGDAPRIVSA